MPLQALRSPARPHEAPGWSLLPLGHTKAGAQRQEWLQIRSSPLRSDRALCPGSFGHHSLGPLPVAARSPPVCLVFLLLVSPGTLCPSPGAPAPTEHPAWTATGLSLCSPAGRAPSQAGIPSWQSVALLSAGRGGSSKYCPAPAPLAVPSAFPPPVTQAAPWHSGHPLLGRTVIFLATL